MTLLHQQLLAAVLLCNCLAIAHCTIAADSLCFDVALDLAAAREPITGRLFVFLSQQQRQEPRFGPDWFRPEPFFGLDVREFQPSSTRRIDDQADGFPGRLSTLPAGKYRIQALLDHDFYEQHHAKGAGNLYSAVEELDLDPRRREPVKLTLDQVVSQSRFRETQSVREVVIKSELLSAFHRREVLDRCAVVLPLSYQRETERRFPVVYIIPGFGGSHRDAQQYANVQRPSDDGEVELIRVMLSGNCKWGHHVYADSPTNGPRGQSLVKELIPHIDATFRTIAAPTARFLSGHSSGGWSALWLQVTYPDLFGGVWSTSPDPVSFSDYQQVDLYADPPLSLYFDPQGQRRPIARRGATPVLWYESFGRMDDCLKRGGQLRSFEAVFSPLGEDRLPRKLWDRQTGRIDPEVARAWRDYDIRLKLEENWRSLAPKLAGKLHITVGSLDTFYLDGAVAQLAQSLKALGSDAQINILAGEDHQSLLTPELFRTMRRQMSAKFREHHAP